MSGRIEIRHDVETEVVRDMRGPTRAYVRLYEIKTVTSREGFGATETTTRRLLDAWTCRVGQSDLTEPNPYRADGVTGRGEDTDHEQQEDA